jgi:hypothetical protein
MFTCDQCKGCAYNTDKYSRGCECFTVAPVGCRNYLSEEDRVRRESIMRAYEVRHSQRPNVIYKRISGSGGKYVFNT